jgi:hypothetical protein
VHRRGQAGSGRVRRQASAGSIISPVSTPQGRMGPIQLPGGFSPLSVS